MLYNIQAVLLDGTLVFTATMGWVPQIGSEIECNGYRWTVQGVRYKLQDGTNVNTNVVLTLKQVR